MANRLAELADAIRAKKLADEMAHYGNYGNDEARAQRWSDLSAAPGRLAQGAFTGLAGAPVDIANMALTPLGLGSERPVGGSNQLAEMINAPTESAAYQAGTMLPISPEGLAMGGAKLAGLAGIFAGKGAKTADLAKMLKAEELRASGVPDEQIWKETGWTFGFPDKQPRFEIPDNAAKVSAAALNYVAQNPQEMKKINAVVRHPDLYAAYPEAADISLFTHKGSGANFSATGQGGSPAISLSTFDEPRSPTLHELQHAIQQREGFARGGSPDTSAGVGMTKDNTMDFARRAYEQSHQTSGDPLLEELLGGAKKWEELTPREQLGWIDQGRMMAYKNLAGEAEARLTQARMNMTPEERAASYPPDMFDVPVGQQIVRYGDDIARSAPNKTEYELAHETAQRNATLPVEQGGNMLADLLNQEQYQ